MFCFMAVAPSISSTRTGRPPLPAPHLSPPASTPLQPASSNARRAAKKQGRGQAKTCQQPHARSSPFSRFWLPRLPPLPPGAPKWRAELKGAAARRRCWPCSNSRTPASGPRRVLSRLEALRARARKAWRAGAALHRADHHQTESPLLSSPGPRGSIIAVH